MPTFNWDGEWTLIVGSWSLWNTTYLLITLVWTWFYACCAGAFAWGTLLAWQVFYGSSDKNHARWNGKIVVIRFGIQFIWFYVIQLWVTWLWLWRCARICRRNGQRRSSGRITLVKKGNNVTALQSACVGRNYWISLTPRPHYNGGIWKCRFHSEKHIKYLKEQRKNP